MSTKFTLAAACFAVIVAVGCRSDRNSCGQNQCGAILPNTLIPNTAAAPVDPAYTGGGQIAPYGGVRSLPTAAPAPYRGPAGQPIQPAPRETRRVDFDI